jgi:hypothetical protein
VGSNPGEVIDSFNLPNPSSRTMVPGFTQPLIEMSTRNIKNVSGEGNLKAIWADCLNNWDSRHVTNI